MYGAVLRVVKREEVAAEVLNDAFMRYWDKADSYDASKGRLYTWMLNIARNLAIDKTRSREFSQAGKTDSAENFVYAEASFPAEQMRIDGIGLTDLLKRLKPEQAEIIHWMYFQGYTQTEIEEKLNIPLGTVKTRLRAGMMMLRKLLDSDK